MSEKKKEKKEYESFESKIISNKENESILDEQEITSEQNVSLVKILNNATNRAMDNIKFTKKTILPETVYKHNEILYEMISGLFFNEKHIDAELTKMIFEQNKYSVKAISFNEASKKSAIGRFLDKLKS